MPEIKQVKLPNGTIYDVKDVVSGYTTNTGTVTSVAAGTGLVTDQTNNGAITTSGSISLDTTRAVTLADIQTGTDTTNKLISAKTISDAIGSSGGGGTATDVQINGTSIVSNNQANIITNSAYNASTNKIATMADVDVVNITYTVISGTDYEMTISTVSAPAYAQTIIGESY